jgi:hypothetical protein
MNRRTIPLAVVLGAGVALTACTAAEPVVSEPGPELWQPGPALADPVTAVHTGPATVDPGPVPEGATHVQVDLTCLTAGTFAYNGGAGMSCPENAVPGTGTSLIPVPDGQTGITVDTSAEARWQITATYVNNLPAGGP